MTMMTTMTITMTFEYEHYDFLMISLGHGSDALDVGSSKSLPKPYILYKMQLIKGADP